MPVNLLNERDLNNYLTDVVYHGQEMETFKSGNFKSAAFVEQNKDAIIRSMLLQYFKHRLRSHLAEDLPEHKAFLILVKANTPNLPTWAEHCLAENKQVYRFEADRISLHLTESISMIRDYLYSVAESYVNKTLARVKDTKANSKQEVLPKLRIDYLKTQEQYDSFDKTLSEAKKWHDIMEEKALQKERNEAMYQASLGGTHSIMKLSDGMEIVQLTTPEALDYESEYMGHCVGKGDYDDGVKKGKIKIYSLRDADGMPHATFEIRVNGKNKKTEIHQCKGKGNKAPIAKYRPYVQEFVKKEKFEIKGDSANIGLIRQVDKNTGLFEYYDMYNLPKDKNFVVDGDLDLTGQELTELPNLSNLIVKGNFLCGGNNLSDLSGCPKEVWGDLDCSFNQITSLKGISQTVRGNLCCWRNQIHSFEYCPAEIGGDIDCRENLLTSFKYFPQKVKGNLWCNDNMIENFDYAPKFIEGAFDIAGNKFSSLINFPENVKLWTIGDEDFFKKFGIQFDDDGTCLFVEDYKHILTALQKEANLKKVEQLKEKLNKTSAMNADIKSGIAKTKESGYGYISESDRRNEHKSHLNIEDMKDAKGGFAK